MPAGLVSGAYSAQRRNRFRAPDDVMTRTKQEFRKAEELPLRCCDGS